MSGARGDVASHKGGFAGALSAQHEGASAAGDAHTRSLQPAPASALPATATAGTESDPEPAQDAEASIAFDGATTLASLQARAEPQTAPTQPAGAALPNADEPTAATPDAEPLDGRAVNAGAAPTLNPVAPTPAEPPGAAGTALGTEADPAVVAGTEPVTLAAGPAKGRAVIAHTASASVMPTPAEFVDAAVTAVRAEPVAEAEPDTLPVGARSPSPNAEASEVDSSMLGPSIDPEDAAPANAPDVPDTPAPLAGASLVPAAAVHTDDLSQSAAAEADRPAARSAAVAAAAGAAAGGEPPLARLEMAGGQGPALSADAGTANGSPATAITAGAGTAMATGPATSAPPAAAPALPPLPIADAAAALAEQIETMVEDEVWQMKLRLDPPRLGTVDVHLAVRDQQVAVSLVSGDAQARMLLAQALPELSNALAAKGLQLMGADVGQSSSQGRDDAPARRVARPAREAAADLSRVAPQAGARQGLLDRYA
ncbi:MAG: flagellar hook-length control protein FliK [Pseudomonadota bacterium]|nr:flagellar hook-length control protein FliK [Pseudomonadota bacterium]